MSLDQYLLNLGLLIFVLATNLGRRRVGTARLVMPLALVAVAAVAFLRDLPQSGNDPGLEAVAALIGVALGVLAGRLMRVERDGRSVLTHAGAAYAALWVVVIGGRVLFAHGASHWFAPGIARFSVEHAITGADAWTAAFVLMALAMVVGRVAVTAAWTTSVRRAPAAAVA